jgi:hypothetical protein
VQAYQATGNPAFLTEAESIASYFFQHLPSDYVPYWDFNAPAASTTPRDTSAAAIAADGLVMLSTVAKTTAQRATYLTEAEDILESLSRQLPRALERRSGSDRRVRQRSGRLRGQYRADLWRLLLHRGAAASSRRAQTQAGLGPV